MSLIIILYSKEGNIKYEIEDSTSNKAGQKKVFKEEKVRKREEMSRIL